MLVYRFERWDGYMNRYSGPYTHNKHCVFELHNAHNKCDMHPSVRDDIPTFKRGDMCAFGSTEQLLAWFDSFIDLLFDYGFSLAVYDVDTSEVKHGTYQIAIPTNSKCIERHYNASILS